MQADFCTVKACHYWVGGGFHRRLSRIAQGSGEQKTVGEEFAFCYIFDRNRIASNSPFDVFCFPSRTSFEEKTGVFKSLEGGSRTWDPSGGKSDRGQIPLRQQSTVA